MVLLLVTSLAIGYALLGYVVLELRRQEQFTAALRRAGLPTE